MGKWKIKTQPSEEPVTLSEAKAHLNIPSAITDWDSLITRQIATARQYVEDFIGGCLVSTTILEYFDEFPCGCLELSRFPVSSVTSVKYTDADGAQQTWTSTEYSTDLVSKFARIAPKPNEVWPANNDDINSIVVEYVAGFGAKSAVPELYKDAILLTVGHLFENREDTVHTMPTRVIDLLYRKSNWQF